MPLQPCRECGHRVSTEAKQCPGCGVADPTKSRRGGGPARRGWRRLVLTALLGATAVATGALYRYYGPISTTWLASPTWPTWATRPATPTEPTEPARPGPGATIFPSLTVRLDRTDTRILVTNLDDYPWTACTIDVNAGVFGGGYSQELGDVAAGKQVAARLSAFARTEGDRFDPGTQSVQVVDLHCDTPSGRAHRNGLF